MKVLFLGIDALDSSILDKLIDQLPNFSKLRQQGKMLRVISTFPPDSDTAWATISTGLNPAQHGYVKFVDPLEKSYRIMNKEEDNRILHGNTFWDILSEDGLKVCAVFPHLCYPQWPTKALMISRAKVTPIVEATNPDLLNLYPQSDLLAGLRGFPDQSSAGMKIYYSNLWKLAEADAEFALRLYKSENWDLFFAYWSTIDAIGHFFWNSYDETDPFFKKENPFRDVIPGTYRLFDGILGKFLEAVGDDVTVILLSDHGHGARPIQTVNVNEILKQAGYLKLNSIKKKPMMALFEKTKRSAIRFISRHGLAKVAGNIMRHVPDIVQVFTRPSLVNWDESIAYTTDMSGIKAYTYGGIVIQREKLTEQEYESVRSRIILEVKEKSRLDDGQSLLKFIARREDIYRGPYLDRYPDIVLEFNYGYGVGWMTNGSLITKTDTYNLVPGSHRGETGTCIIKSPYKLSRDRIDLLDVFPSLLALYNQSVSRPCDGTNIFEQ